MRVALLLMMLMPPALTGAHQQTENPVDIVRQSLAALGGMTAIEQAGGVQARLSGEFDLNTRLQGRSPFRPELTPITETISVDTAGQRLAYSIDWYNYYQSNQQLLEIYDERQRALFVDLRNRNGGWLPFATAPDAPQRYARLVPQLLLAEALQRSEYLNWLASGEVNGQPVDSVEYVTPAGDKLTLHIHQTSRLLLSAVSPIDMPLLGKTEVSWHWSGYPDAGKPGAPVFPRHFESRLAGKRMKSGELTIEIGLEPDAFEIPNDIDTGEPPQTLTSGDEFVPYGQREPRVETVAPGVHMVVNLRPGFRLMFVEFDDFVLAVDAPTGWYEMQQIPPMNWSFGDDVDALGRKYLSAIEQTAPGKPVRYVVLTHHHSDHIGGIQPFIDAGATLLAGRAAAHMLDLSRDVPEVEIIDGQKTISDGFMQVELIKLPDGNPKADDYLMIYLPEQKILYATAFMYPVPESVFPLRESVPLSRYFVEWLDGSGLDVEHIYNVHGQGLVQDWQLQWLRGEAAE